MFITEKDFSMLYQLWLTLAHPHISKGVKQEQIDALENFLSRREIDREKRNAKTAKYIAEKRKINKNYAR